ACAPKSKQRTDVGNPRQWLAGFLHPRRRKASRTKEDVMTDPRFTDPRLNDPVDPRLSDPVIRRDESAGGMWGWIAGVAVLLLIGFVIIAGWDSNRNTVSSRPKHMTTRR